MKTLLAALTLALLLVNAPVHAQNTAPGAAPAPAAESKKPDEATMKTAAEFVEVTQSTTIVDKLLPIISKNFTALLLRDNPGKAEIIGQLMQNTFAPSFTSHIEGFKRHMAFIYASNLTREQLEQLIAFYKTPVGQAYLKVMPTVMEQTMAFAKVWMGENVREAVSKLTAELQKNSLTVPKEMSERK